METLMLNRRTVSAALFAAGAVLASGFAASAGEKFSQAALEAAQAAGKPILVEITAPWCSTCKAQKPILSELTKDPKFKNLVTLELDFDSQKDALRALNARSQSTLIVFKGKTETGRSVGDTNKASIAKLLETSI
jgi:thioredoxin 1